MTATITPIKPAAQVGKLTFATPSLSKAAVNGINAAIGGASTDPSRLLLTKVLVQFIDGKLKLVTTNSYRANRVWLTALDGEHTDSMPFIVDAAQLKAAMPKPSVFKTTGHERLTLAWYPGERELDAGQFHITWDNEQRIVVGDPDKGSAGSYPDVESLIKSTHDEIRAPGSTNEAVCYNPKFLADIAREAKLINKDRFVKVTPGATPMKPAMFETCDDESGTTYESLLMPVRES